MPIQEINQHDLQYRVTFLGFYVHVRLRESRNLDHALEPRIANFRKLTTLARRVEMDHNLHFTEHVS